MIFQSINPATEEVIAAYPATSRDQVEKKIIQCHKAFESWRSFSFHQRGEYLLAAAELLEKKRDEHARLMAQEMGKPLTQGRREVDKCCWGLRHFAEKGGEYLKAEIIPSDAAKSYVAYEPLGLVFGIMPWNFPLWQFFRCAAPTLMAGNGLIIKHAPNVSGCALSLEKLMEEAGFPKSLISVLLIEEKSAASVIAHPLVSAVTLTGSTRAGRAVAALAGAHLKKVVLELGGSDPYLILEDADLDYAVSTTVAARLHNAGQTCIASKRMIVAKSLFKRFEEMVVEVMKKQKVGDPIDEKTDIGPMARKDLRKNLHRQVTRSLKKGAQCLLGGKIPKGPGFFYPPTVLSHVGSNMPATTEEIFGPVAVLLMAKDEKEAIRLANDSSYGLGAAVFTQDKERGERIAASQLMAGNCFVNAMVKSDPRLPFGGIKNSGTGRELGPHGIKEFVNIKTVYVK